jgi:hypothetical protein
MKTPCLALALGVSLFGAACAGRSPVGEQWGYTTAITYAAQAADPNAPTDDEPAVGMDPKSGEAVAERYYRGQRTQQTRQAPAIVITGGN